MSLFSGQTFRFRAAALLLALAAGMWVTAAAVPPVSDDYLLRRWDMDDGLPQNSISAIVQGQGGYLWLGTRGGLVRFDGLQFKVFRTFDETNQFPADVRCLTTDAGGSLLIGFERAAVVRERSEKFELLAPPEDYSDRIYALAADGSGDIWAGYSKGGLGHWAAGRWETLNLDPTNKNKADRFRDNVICCADTERRIWFASEWFVGYLDGGTPVMLRENDQAFFNLAPRREGGVWLTSKRSLEIATTNGIVTAVADLNELGIGFSGDIQILYEDRQGALWIGTKGKGLFRYFDGRVERVPTSHNYIRSLCEDREGNLWVGTGGGGLDRLRLRNVRLYDRSNFLPKDLIVSLCEATDGSLWIAPSEAMPFQFSIDRRVVMPQTNHWDTISGITLCPDHSGGVWLGSYNRGIFHLGSRFYKLAGFENEEINSVLEDTNGILWAGTLHAGILSLDNGQVSRFPTTNGLQSITALAEDSTGNLWVGTFSGNLYKRIKDGFQRFDETAGMPGTSIQTIYGDGPGRLWIGTRGGGLLRFQSGQIRQVTRAQGLADDDVRQILVDDEDGLWIGSAHGLSRISRREVEAVMDGKESRFEPVEYDRNEGLGSIEFSEGFHNAACRTQDGKLWFATTRGMVEVDPKRVPINPLPPILHIEGLQVDDRSVSITNRRAVVIPAGTRSVQLRYTGLDFASPENVHFRCRLEPVETDWLNVGTERTATYLRLPPGNYKFHVTARSSRGVWLQDGVDLDFIVLPTLWQSVYFRALLTALLLVCVAVITRAILLRRVRARMRALEQVQALNNERRRIARDMHDELGASLTRIELMGHQVLRSVRLDAEISAQVGRIGTAVREVVQTLDQIVWTVNPGNDRLDRVIGYLSQFAMDFLAPTKIQLRQELPEIVPPTSMPSRVRHELLLTLKEALNNAVKHSGATEITLKVALEKTGLQITLADNGQGFDQAETPNTGDGLANLGQRLNSIGGECRVESAIGRGSEIRMFLPLPLTIPS